MPVLMILTKKPKEKTPLLEMKGMCGDVPSCEFVASLNVVGVFWFE